MADQSHYTDGELRQEIARARNARDAYADGHASRAVRERVAARLAALQTEQQERCYHRRAARSADEYERQAEIAAEQRAGMR